MNNNKTLCQSNYIGLIDTFDIQSDASSEKQYKQKDKANSV